MSTEPALMENYNATPLWTETTPAFAGTLASGTFASEAALAASEATGVKTTVSSLHVNQTQKSIKDLLYNGTGYYIEDEGETGLNDLQTVFLACFATLLPLIITLLTAFGIRLLWKKYQRRKKNLQYDGILHTQGTSESTARPLHSHLLGDKPCGATNLVLSIDDVEVCRTTELNSQIRSNSHSNTNGSIITMTMKNNHLIVETEERSDLQEDSRETTMTYSPGARDGVFVVEVQQGVRRSPSSGGPTSCAEPEISVSVSDQCALVHNPPDRYSDEETLEDCDDSEYYMETSSQNRETPDSIASQVQTGLAQSNTSLGHPSYCYTNQQCYDINSYGCSVYTSGTGEFARRLHDDTRPKIMSAVYKSCLKRSPTTEDLHLASLNGAIVGVDLGKSSDDEAQEEQSRLGNSKQGDVLCPSPKFEKAQDDISPTKRMGTDSRSGENEGFVCNDLKS